MQNARMDKAQTGIKTADRNINNLQSPSAENIMQNARMDKAQTGIKIADRNINNLQSPSAVILEPQKIKSDTVSTVSPSISHQVMGPDAMIFVF